MDAYALPRFIQYSQRRISKVVTERDGTFVAVLFENREVDVFDTRKDTRNDRGSSSRKNVLRLRNVVHLAFMRITTAKDENDSNAPASYSSPLRVRSRFHYRGNARNRRRYKPGSHQFYHALLVARQYNNDEYLRMGVFVEFSPKDGWCEIPCTTIKHSDHISMAMSQDDAVTSKTSKKGAVDGNIVLPDMNGAHGTGAEEAEHKASLFRDWDDDQDSKLFLQSKQQKRMQASLSNDLESKEAMDTFQNNHNSHNKNMNAIGGMGGNGGMGGEESALMQSLFKPFEMPLKQIDNSVMFAYDNVVAMASSYWGKLYLWRMYHFETTKTVRLTQPVAVPINSNDPLQKGLMTKHAVFAADSKVLRVVPLYEGGVGTIGVAENNNVKYSGQVELPVANITNLSRITNTLVGGVDMNFNLYIFGISVPGVANNLNNLKDAKDAKDAKTRKQDKQGFEAWFVHVVSGLPAVLRCCFVKVIDARNAMSAMNAMHAMDSMDAIDAADGKEALLNSVNVVNKDQSGTATNAAKATKAIEIADAFEWGADCSYMMILSMPNYSQIYCVLLNKKFLSALIHCKETKRSVNISDNNSYPSHLICGINNNLDVVVLQPDLIFLPTNRDIHAYRFAWRE